MIKPRLAVVFFATSSQVEPVRLWLRGLSKQEKICIGMDLKIVQFDWSIGLPLVKSLSNGIWELRSNLPGGKISRILFFINSNTMILVNGFIKKSQKIPNRELELSRKRKKQWEQVNE